MGEEWSNLAKKEQILGFNVEFLPYLKHGLCISLRI